MNQELHRWAKAQLARAEDAYQTWKDPALLNNPDERVGKLAIYRVAQSLRDVQMWKQVITGLEGNGALMDQFERLAQGLNLEMTAPEMVDYIIQRYGKP